MNTPPPSGAPQPDSTPQPKLNELLAALGYNDPAPPPDPPPTPVPAEPNLIEQPLPEQLKPEPLEPPWTPPPAKPERIRQPLSCVLQVLFVIVLLSLTIGCSITDSPPVKFGLLLMAGFVLYYVAAQSGTSTTIRVILITVGLVVCIPVAVVAFLFAACMFGSKGFSRTAPEPPMSSAHNVSRH